MDTTLARHNMVSGQLRPNRITQPAVLKAFTETPREAFTSEPAMAYADSAAPMGEGRHMPSPLLAATLIQSLNLQGGESVLVVADGSGSTAAACAATLQHLPGGGTVNMTEPDSSLLKYAKNHLSAAQVATKQAPWEEGWPQEGPYSAILISTPVPSIPESLKSQLKPGGKLVALRQKTEGSEAVLLTKSESGTTYIQTSLLETDLKTPETFTPPETFTF